MKMLAAIVAALALTACERTPQVITVPAPGASPSAEAPAASPLVLRTYALPKAHIPQAFEALRVLLKGAGQPLGQVRVGPGGNLMVLTTEAVHQGVAQFVAEMKTLPATAETGAPNIAGHYWFVVARPGEGEDDAALAALAPALGAVEKAQGPMQFSLLEHVQLQSGASGPEAETQGRRVEVKQSIYAMPGGDLRGRLKLKIDGQKAEIATEINLQSGAYVILGQAGYGALHQQPIAGSLKDTTLSDDAILLYVTRFDVQP